MLVRKTGRRVPEGFDAAAALLETVFPGIPVTVLDESRSAVQQLAGVANTTVMVAGNGGGSFAAWFLPEGAAAVFFDTRDAKRGSIRFFGEARLWSNLPTIRDLYYPVTPADVVAATDNMYKLRVRLDGCRLARLVVVGLRHASHTFGLPDVAEGPLDAACPAA